MKLSEVITDVSSKYGAPMGRHSGSNYLECEAGKIGLMRVPINNGGYDSGGAYWGIGQPLYCAYDIDGNYQFLRAASRDKAKAAILDEWEDAKFFR